MVEQRTRDQKVSGSSPGKMHRENFLLQGQLSVLTIISVLIHRRVTALARKRSLSFCQKCRFHLNTHMYVTSNSDTVNWCLVVLCTYNLH